MKKYIKIKERIIENIKKYRTLYYIAALIIVISLVFIQRLMKDEKLLYNNNFMRNMAFGITVSFIIIYAILYYIIYIKEYSLEKICFCGIIFLGIYYMILIPPYVVPDEQAHLNTSYTYSNEILGIERLENHPKTIYMRADDANTLFTDDLNIESYKYIFTKTFQKAHNTKLIEINIRFLSGNWHNYIISACGIALGRLLGLSTPLVYNMGRLFNLIIFALLMYYAVKKIPFGKSLLCVILLCPMVLQQAASYSYDVMINAVGILAIALTLYIIFKKSEVKKREIVILIFLLILLSFNKGGVYIPICIWCLFFSRKIFDTKKSQIIYFIGILILLILLAVIKNSSGITNSVETSGEKFIEWANEPGYTIEYALKHFDKTIKIFFNTILSRGGVYIYTMIGGALGPFRILIQIWVILFYCILITLLIFINKDKEEITGKINNILGIICSITTCVLIITAMFLGHTPLSSNVIQGVQGRYFIPVLPLVVLILKKNKWQLHYNIDKYVLTTAVLLQYFVFMDIINYVI